REERNFTPDRGQHIISSHGTEVATIIHALAPEAKIVSYKVISDDRSPKAMMVEEVIEALLAALSDAAETGRANIIVIAASLKAKLSKKWNKKIAELARKGVMVVVAAGNNGRSDPGKVGSPANAADAVTVGAVNFHNQPWPDSTSGEVDVGEASILKPEIHTFGVN